MPWTPLGDFCPQSPSFAPLRNKFLATPLVLPYLLKDLENLPLPGERVGVIADRIRTRLYAVIGGGARWNLSGEGHAHTHASPSLASHILRTRDGNGSSFVTHDPWPLHYFILLMGLGGGVAWWYWTTLSVLKANKIVD